MSLILFIGSRSHFPDCLLRMVENEIEGSSTARLTTPDDLVKITAGKEYPRLVILEDSLWPQINSGNFAEFSAGGRVSLAIAFRHAQRLSQGYVFCPEQSGGLSFLPMDLNVETWLGVVRLLLTGCILVPSDLQAPVNGTPIADRVASPKEDAETTALDKLTPRERDVLALVAEGMQNKHIAGHLHLSEHTVKLHLHHVISKLGARNRTEAALKYRRNGPM